MVYVLSVDAPAILKMASEQPSLRSLIPDAAAAASSPGETLYQRNCQACHGANRQGSGQIPSLVDITGRLGVDVIRGVIQNGAGQMPAFGNLGDKDLADLITYLAESSGHNKLLTAPAQKANTPRGPVVGSGGAPAGQTAPGAKLGGMSPYGIMDGPAYPEGVDAPKERYFTGWNVMYNIINPPWNTLTAYDLNTGTIKWKSSVGDDPGIMMEQRGIISTSTGLLFLASADGKVRAMDDETGKVLWTGVLPSGARGVPALYEANGTEYLVVSATLTA